VPHRILLLQNEIRGYAWGSRTALAELTGRSSPAPGPEAELWMGAHPGAPSKLSPEGAEIGLDAWIRRDPDGVLGAEVARRFDAELPFLLKVVAPDRALSIQAHPDAEQAREGFARENAAGLTLDAPNRNYRDCHHKPEIVCALTPFDAMCGFRPIDEIVAGVGALSLPGLREALAALEADRSRRGLADFFRGVMTRSAEARTALAHQVAEQAARGAGDADTCRCAVWLAEQYPGDPGVLAPFLLNAVRLEPGEALFLPAGELHCYLSGVAMEAMANSDNVLRGGLTPKHMDVPELLRTLSFRDGRPPVLRPRQLAPGLAVYDTPVAEFELAVLRPRPDRPVRCTGRSSVEILFCAEGEAQLLDDRREVVALPRGAAALVPAAVPTLLVEGDAKLFRAGVPG
jgi:mannose-6-phosphate isomerase